MKKELGTEEARSGKTLNEMRYVLGISTVLIIVAFAVVYLFLAA
jgi:hypothetical protein